MSLHVWPGTTDLDAGPIDDPESVTGYDRPKHICFHPYVPSGNSNGLEDCKGFKSVFQRSRPCEEVKQSTLQMFYFQVSSSAFTQPDLANIKNWNLC